jgi:hypothetical protein
MLALVKSISDPKNDMAAEKLLIDMRDDSTVSPARHLYMCRSAVLMRAGGEPREGHAGLRSVAPAASGVHSRQAVSNVPDGSAPSLVTPAAEQC